MPYSWADKYERGAKSPKKFRLESPRLGQGKNKARSLFEIELVWLLLGL